MILRIDWISPLTAPPALPAPPGPSRRQRSPEELEAALEAEEAAWEVLSLTLSDLIHAEASTP